MLSIRLLIRMPLQYDIETMSVDLTIHGSSKYHNVYVCFVKISGLPISTLVFNWSFIVSY